jgi:hypothetical protein
MARVLPSRLRWRTGRAPAQRGVYGHSSCVFYVLCVRCVVMGDAWSAPKPAGGGLDEPLLSAVCIDIPRVFSMF